MKRFLNATTIVVASALLLAACGGGSDDPPAPPPVEEPDPAIAEREAIKTAIDTATTAVNAVDNDSTDAEVMAADTAMAAARKAIADAANVPAEEKAANTGTVNALATVLASAKKDRTDAMSDADRIAAEMRAARAAKLYAGISAPGGTGVDTRTAAYGTGANADDIAVTIGEATAVNLSEDGDAVVAALHGWEGKDYTASPTGGGTYEARVYSNVDESEMGARISTILDASGMVPDGTLTTNAGLVASPSFDQSAGDEGVPVARSEPGRRDSHQYRWQLFWGAG